MGGGGTTNSVSQFQPPANTQPGWNNYVNTVSGLTANPIPTYEGPTVAPWNATQQSASDMGYNLATGGSPASNAANSQITFQASGGAANPYATTANPYMGDNPELQSVIDASNKDISRNFATGTAAQTDAAFQRAGAFGGSAYANQQAKNARSLSDSLALNTSNLRNQNYYNSSNLAENLLNRSTSAWQNNQQNALTASGLGLQSENNNWNAINNLMNIGGSQNNYLQNLLNAGQTQFGNSVMAPFTTMDLLGNALSRASGGQGTTTQQTAGPGYSPWGNAAGMGLLGYGLSQG